MTAFRRLTGALLALAAALPMASIAGAAPPSKSEQADPAAVRDGSHDFDFSFGSWTEHSRRLMHPLSGANDWVEWDGTTIVHKIMGGKANMAEFRGVTPAGPLKLLALRIYNPKTDEWSLDFATEKVGKLGSPPSIGRFKDGRIDFYDQEPFNGKMILLRFSVYPLGHNKMEADQAFSADGGKTWEVNWTNIYTRVGS